MYQQGKLGVHFSDDARNNAIVQPFPVRTAKDTQLLYFNIDFRSTSPAKEGEGSYRFYLGHGPGPSAAVEFFANATTFFVRHGDAIEEVRRLETNSWYNVQLVLNLVDRTFTGSIGKPGEVTSFTGKAFHSKWDGTLDHFFIDGYGHVGAAVAVKSAHEVDNIAIRTTPFPPVGETSAAAESASVAAERVRKSAELQAKVAALNQQLGDVTRQKSELMERTVHSPWPMRWRMVKARMRRFTSAASICNRATKFPADSYKFSGAIHSPPKKKEADAANSRLGSRVPITHSRRG